MMMIRRRRRPRRNSKSAQGPHGRPARRVLTDGRANLGAAEDYDHGDDDDVYSKFDV